MLFSNTNSSTLAFSSNASPISKKISVIENKLELNQRQLSSQYEIKFEESRSTTHSIETDFDKLKKANQELRVNTSKIFDFLEKKNFKIHNNITRKNQNDKIKDLLLSSVLIEEFKSRVNLYSIKLAKTSCSLSNKIVEICEIIKQLDESKFESAESNFIDIFNTYVIISENQPNLSDSKNQLRSSNISSMSMIITNDQDDNNMLLSDGLSCSNNQIKNAKTFNDLIIEFNENLTKIETIINDHKETENEIENKKINKFFLDLNNLINENKKRICS